MINTNETQAYNIAVGGTGYVGLSLAVLLSQYNHVTAVDIETDKVEKINNKISPIQDEYIERFLLEKELDLSATEDARSAYKSADFVIVATPTNYDPKKNFFDTSAVEAVIEQVLECNDQVFIIIKSTIPVGYTKTLHKRFGTERIFIFSGISKGIQGSLRQSLPIPYHRWLYGFHKTSSGDIRAITPTGS